MDRKNSKGLGGRDGGCGVREETREGSGVLRALKEAGMEQARRKNLCFPMDIVREQRSAKSYENQLSFSEAC